MKKRSIIFFPKFNNQGIIENIRNRYDPLVKEIAPHISIVFPFDSDLTTTELVNHIKKNIKGLAPFKAQFKSFSGSSSDGFIFLDCITGNDEIINFHDILYTGILAQYLYNETPYFPHITVGRIAHSSKFSQAINDLNEQFKAEDFSCVIDKIYIETIDEQQTSIIESSISLQA